MALIAGLGLAAACVDSTSVGDLNNVSADALSAGLTRASTGLLVTGLLNSERANDFSSRYLVFTETLGRDFYREDNAEARWVTEMLFLPMDYSGFTGGGLWGGPYVTVRSANTILNNIDAATGLSAAEIAATKGLAKTFEALSFYRIAEARDSIGMAIDVNHPIDTPPAPLVCKANALAYVSALLDTAITNLTAAGATPFPFTLPGGFSLNGTFNTPASFLKVAQGLKGKVEFYRALDRTPGHLGTAANLTAALNALNASFIEAAPTAASLKQGVYHIYSTAAGEISSPLADANIYLNETVGDSIQAGDLRASKITVLAATKTLNNTSTKYKSPLTDPSGALTAPIALLKETIKRRAS